MSDRGETRDLHEFVFELDRAIRDQVVRKLEDSPMLALTRNAAPNKSGVYALYHRGRLVYVGKASKGTTRSKRTLRGRLNEHLGKVDNREKLSLGDMTCRFLTIESDWFVWAAEFALINHYEPEWNNSGFGSKTPGKGRPGTERVSKFNLMFPLRHGTSASKEDNEDLAESGDHLGGDDAGE